MAEESTSFWARLKQHHIYRVAAWYGATIAVLIQVVARAFPYFGWLSAVPAVIIILIAGFPVAIVLAWILVKPTDPASQTRWQRRHWKLGAVVVPVVIAAVVASGYFAWGFSERHAQRLDAASVTTSAIPAKSIAVLPFENLSDDKKNDYFVAGVQDLILTKLADIGDLKVIARTSTAKYASHPEDLKSIGRQLGVATILEGSVQKQGKQVLINVQLIDTNSDSHIWAQDYTRTLDNVFGVEGEVAETIATALDAKLSSAEAANLTAVPTRNQAAYDLFLRAEYRMNKADVSGDPRDRNAAIPLYRQAIERDPGFALAYARLSLAEGAVAWYGGIGQNAQQLFTQARTDAEHALKLAPGLAAAQLALGYNDYWSRFDFDGALKAFAAALTLRPNDPDVLDAQGLVQRRTGRCDAAIASFERAFGQDPRNSALATDLSSAYMCAYRYPDAERWAQRALTLEPNNVPGREAYVYSILFGSGDITRALAAAQGDAPRLKVGAQVPLLVLLRRYAQAMQVLDSVPENEVSDKFLLYVVARIPQRKAELYRLMGEPERAKPLYERILPELRKQLELREGTYHLAAIWNLVAQAELGLGRTAEGLDAIAKSLSMKSKDRLGTANLMERNAELYAQAGRPELAVPLLSRALVTPGIGEFYSPVMLWLDPAWDPVRRNPRFQALLQQYAKFKPAVTYDQAPAAATSS